MKELTPLSVAWDAWLAKRAGLDVIMERQQRRLQELISFAREHSRCYAEKYKTLPHHTEVVKELNDFQPAMLAGYATMLMLLAQEQEAGNRSVRNTIPFSHACLKIRIGHIFTQILQALQLPGRCIQVFPFQLHLLQFRAVA